jgi:hypothetical protein
MFLLASRFVLLDFSVSDNDGLYVLTTFAAVAFAIVLIVTVMRQSRASDRHLQRQHTLRATPTPPEELPAPTEPQP